uniref:Uncharacterized protein n=1 Tax=Rhizophora mucronata TaxID=61149 RepID=A0A2P2MTM5_RHIMU
MYNFCVVLLRMSLAFCFPFFWLFLAVACWLHLVCVILYLSFISFDYNGTNTTLDGRMRVIL